MIATLLIASFSALLLELSLRLFRMDLAPLLSVSHQPCLYIEDERYGYRYQPNGTDVISRYFEMNNVVTMNSRGFHDREHAPAGDNRIHRILVIGDSFTAGLHVPTGDVWTQVLEKSLNQPASASRFEVVNLGIDGTGTDIHELVLKDNLPVYKPDTVILAFYENDIGDLTRPKLYKSCYRGNVLVYQNGDQRKSLRDYIDEHSPGTIVRWLFDKLYIVRLPVNLYKRSGRRIDALFLLDSNYLFPSAIGVRRWSWGELPHRIDDHLRDLAALSERYDFRLLIVPVPTKNSITESLSVLRESASSGVLAELEVVDISVPLQGIVSNDGLEYQDLFWRYDGHFNSVGNDVFGRAVFQVLNETEDTARE